MPKFKHRQIGMVAIIASPLSPSPFSYPLIRTVYFLVNAYIRVNRGQMVLPLLEEMSRLNAQRTKDFYESTIRQLAAKKASVTR